MKNIGALLLVLVTCETYAIFGGTIHITPETERKYGLSIQFTAIEKPKNAYRIKLRAVDYDDKHAWLTITTKDIMKVEEKLLLDDLRRGVKPITENILVRAKLHPIVMENELYYEVEIDAEYARNGYIYIDYPADVLDGGYRYLVDLGTYADRHERQKVGAGSPWSR